MFIKFVLIFPTNLKNRIRKLKEEWTLFSKFFCICNIVLFFYNQILIKWK